MTFSHDAPLKHVIWRVMDLNEISRDTPPKTHVIWSIYGI